MRLGVISDTHAKEFDELPAPVLTALAGVDLIVHAGDFTEKAVLTGLKALGEVKAVCGNMDGCRRHFPFKTKRLATVKVQVLRDWFTLAPDPLGTV